MSCDKLSVHCELLIPSCAGTDMVCGCKSRDLSMNEVKRPQWNTLKTWFNKKIRKFSLLENEGEKKKKKKSGIRE